MGMKTLASESGKVKSFDGTNLYYVKDIPEGLKAVIVIVHGFCEHLGRYEYVKDRLLEYGYGVYRFDNRGHGKSCGERGHIKDFTHLICDADTIVEMAKKENPNVPIFMLGHSMGGFITAAYGIKYKDKLNGQILSGAALIEPEQVMGIKGTFLKIINTFVPKMKIQNKLSTLLSRDERVVKDYENDPLNLKDATLKFHIEFLVKGIKWVRDNVEKYEYPCYIFHGGEDKIVDKQGSENFFSMISSTDKELKIYEGLYHECLNEKEKDMVLEDIHNWIEKRV